MTLRVTFGVDPGLSGAVATLLDGEPGPVLDMPVMRTGDKGEVDAVSLAAFVREIRGQHPGASFAAGIERVRAMPDRSGPNVRKMGAQSSFNFGDGFGQVKSVFRVLGVPTDLVEAAVWKRRFALLGQDKDAARLLAITRFPSAAPQLQRKKDCGRADALWVALWCDHRCREGRLREGQPQPNEPDPA